MLTTTQLGVAATYTLVACPRLPEGQQYVELPRPGAPAFCPERHCPKPCGRAVCLMAKVTPVPPQRQALQLPELRVAEAHERLVTSAQQAPAPLACDLTMRTPAPALGTAAVLAAGAWHRN